MDEKLYGNVMTALGREARRTAFRRFALHAAMLALTSAGTAIAVWRLGTAAEASGFTEYLSLAVTDGGEMAAAGGDFAAVVLETLPVTPALASASMLLATLWSLAVLVRDVRIFRAD